jgi:hypothetical protein
MTSKIREALEHMRDDSYDTETRALAEAAIAELPPVLKLAGTPPPMQFKLWENLITVTTIGTKTEAEDVCEGLVDAWGKAGNPVWPAEESGVWSGDNALDLELAWSIIHALRSELKKRSPPPEHQAN